MTLKQKFTFYSLLTVSILSCILAGVLLFGGLMPKQGWLDAGGSYSYLDRSGTPVTGWQTIRDKTYYFDENGHMVTGWILLPDGRYCFDETGTPVTGWVQQGFSRCHFSENGRLDIGWQTVDGSRYYFAENGSAIEGWFHQDGSIYYLKVGGAAAAGITDIDGALYYFNEENQMVTGWLELSSGRFYFDEDGKMVTGWQEIGLERYFFLDSGILYTGWLTWGEDRYYLQPDGSADHGVVEIGGETHFFSPKGIETVLVNAQNPIPSYYQPEIVTLTEWHRISTVALEPLRKMLADCRKAGFDVDINSTYRTREQQENILNLRTEEYEQQGMSYDLAYAKARETVNLPDTSEHQLGLSADLVGEEANVWLAAHCHEYGFIVRYPDGKADITGITYEPWHYRYVGKAVAADMLGAGLCLEEYLGAVAVG